MMKFLLKNTCFVILFSSCAIMHHTQVGEIDSAVVLSGKRFEILVSETGFSLDEAASAAKLMTNNEQAKDNIESIRSIIALFQMGPRTGKDVMSPEYADNIYSMIKKKCSEGKISGLTSVRETASYPVISGEIVRIIGYCKNK